MLSFLAYWRLTTETHQRLQASLESADDSRVFALSNAIRSYSDFLAGFQLLFTHSDDVTLEEFEGAALAALSDYPGLSGLEWAKFITQDELPDLRAELGVMGLPPLELKQRRPDNTTISIAPRDRMLPVIYAVPRATHAAAYGLDLASGVDAAREVIRSAESTAMIMSPVTKLLVEDSMLGFVVFIPVYKPAKSGRGPAEDHDL